MMVCKCRATATTTSFGFQHELWDLGKSMWAGQDRSGSSRCHDSQTIVADHSCQGLLQCCAWPTINSQHHILKNVSSAKNPKECHYFISNVCYKTSNPYTCQPRWLRFCKISPSATDFKLVAAQVITYGLGFISNLQTLEETNFLLTIPVGKLFK